MSTSQRTSIRPYWEADSGLEFVAVGINYGCRPGGTTVHRNPFNFRLMDGSGVIRSHEWLGQLEPVLQAVDLAPGAKTKGWVTFQAPIGDSNLTLLWEPSLWTETTYIPLR